MLGAVGFETTTPATAVAILEAQKLGLANFSVLVSHKVLLPALRALLDGGEVKVHGFLCPGHASIILGSDAFRPLVARLWHAVCRGRDLKCRADACRHGAANGDGGRWNA